MKWISTKDELPPMVEVFDDDCHERYLVNVLKYETNYPQWLRFLTMIVTSDTLSTS